MEKEKISILYIIEIALGVFVGVLLAKIVEKFLLSKLLASFEYDSYDDYDSYDNYDDE